MNGLDKLKDRLDTFIRRYYLYRLLRGLIAWTGLSLFILTLLLTLESCGHFAANTRAIIFWSSLSLFMLWLFWFVVLPLGKMLRIVKGLNYRDAAEQLDRLEPGLKDRILNTLTLGSVASLSDLAFAAIQQKVEDLDKYRFNLAIDWRSLRRFAWIAVAPLLLLLGLFSWEGEKILDSGRRLVNYNEEFVAPVPFKFIIDGTRHLLPRGDGLSIEIELKGNEIPAELLAVKGGLKILPSKLSSRKWLLELESVRESSEMYFEANGYQSERVEIEVFDVPEIGEIQLSYSPPSYTGLSETSTVLESFHRIPEGSRIELAFRDPEHIDKAWLDFADTNWQFVNYSLAKVLRNEWLFNIAIANSFDTVRMYSGSRILAVKDLAPQIRVRQLDSIGPNHFRVDLDFSDDYGISRLERILRVGEQTYIMPLEFKANGVVDILRLDSLTATQSLELFYRVWDNDGVNGSKSARSNRVLLRSYTEERMEEAAFKSIKSFAAQSEDQKLKREQYEKLLESLEESMVDSKTLDWKNKEKLREQLREIKKERERREKRREKLLQDLEKVKADSLQREELKDRIKEANSKEEELRKLEEELEKLMENLDMKKLKQKLDQLQKENKQQARQDERLDKLLEDLAFQRDLLKEINKLKDLAESLEKEKDIEEAQEEFEKSMDKLDSLAQKNKELSNTLEGEKMQDNEEGVKKALDQASNAEQNDDAQQKKQEMDSASEMMKEMSESLQSMMQQMQSNALQMNMESLRSILENLKQFSLDVEQTGIAIADLGKDDPMFRTLLVQQRKLLSGSQVIKDSLRVLAEKAPQIQERVFTELDRMISELDKAKGALQNQEKAKSATAHQFSMMASNELALLLDNSLQNMMAMMASKKPGKSNCEKPGGSKPKPGQMGKKASEIGQMIDKLQKGNKKGKGQKGGKGGNAREIGQIMSKQEALRQMIKEAEKGNKGKGDKGGDLLEELDRMEDDLLDGNIEQYKERFKRIETRLLEDERAREQRKQKEKRESKSGQNVNMDSGDIQRGGGIVKTPSIERVDRTRVQLVPFYNSLLDIND